MVPLCDAVKEQEVDVIVPEMPSTDAARSIREADVVVIGSGVGGLSCAAILANYGVNVCGISEKEGRVMDDVQVVVLESHYQVGGAAHGWSARGKSGIYHFESGPSLYSGMQSRTIDGNPLGHIFQVWCLLSR